MTGYRRICEVMKSAGIAGAHATPKGLRHAFGVGAIQAQVPLNMVQRWLGHADMKTTAIYTSAIGPEERAIAARMWQDSDELTVSPESSSAPPVREDGSYHILGDRVPFPPCLSCRTAPILGRAAPKVAGDGIKAKTVLQKKIRETTRTIGCDLIQFGLFCNGFCCVCSCESPVSGLGGIVAKALIWRRGWR